MASNRRHRPGTSHDSGPNSAEVERKTIVLGSGADTDYGLPTMATLMYELAAFSRGPGESIDQALRKKLPHLHFTFDRFAARRGDEFLVHLFAGGDEVGTHLRSAAVTLREHPDLGSLATVVEQLCDMAGQNQLSGPSLQGIAQLAGERGQVGQAEPLLDPQRMTLSDLAGNAFRHGFQRVLQGGTALSAEEKDILEIFVVATSNIEQLLSTYFVGYQQGTTADKKNYLYIAWMLWAFLRARSASLGARTDSIYSHLPRLGADVITFNYTNFFDREFLRRVMFFHGRLDRYLRLDTRELVHDDQRLTAARDVQSITAFINEIRLDVKEDPAIDVPAIIPPTSFKPVMSREQLRVWVEADDLIQKASIVILVGYSFGMADEHFNDLVRKSRQKTRWLIVNPDLERSADTATRVLGIARDGLREVEIAGHSALCSSRLTCVGASAADVTPEFVAAVLSQPSLDEKLPFDQSQPQR